jgi:hypothetical protein
MSFSKIAAANPQNRTFMALVVCLSVVLLNGCGSGWQPDPRDKPQSPARSSIEASGLTGPDETRTNL